MTPEDAEFIIDKDSAMACELARLSLRHGEGNTIWKSLLDAGLPAAMRKNTGARADLFCSFGYTENTTDTITFMRAILEDLKPKQRESLFSTEKKGSVVIADWLGAIGSLSDPGGTSLVDEKRIAHFHALVDVVKEYKIEINPVFKAKGRRGVTYDSSALAQAVSNAFDCAENSPYKSAYSQRMELICKLTPKLDDATKLFALEKSNSSAEKIVSMFEEKGWAQREEWLSVASHPRVDKETLAYMQARVARKAVEDVMRHEPAHDAATAVTAATPAAPIARATRPV